MDQATTLWRNPRPRDFFHSRSRMLDEASPVSRCCFLASLRTTNTSKQYEPRVLLSKIPRLHESPQTSGSRRGRGAAGRRVPSARCPFRRSAEEAGHVMLSFSSRSCPEKRCRPASQSTEKKSRYPLKRQALQSVDH